jgi:hypothetical protein
MNLSYLNNVYKNVESDSCFNINFGIFCFEEYYIDKNLTIENLKIKYINKKTLISVSDKSYVNNVNDTFSGKLNGVFSKIYLYEILEGINDVGEKYFYKIFEDNLKNIKKYFDCVFEFKKEGKIANLLNCGFSVKLLDKLIYKGVGRFKEHPLLKMEDGCVIAPFLNIFIENLLNNLFENKIIPAKTTDKKESRGVIGENIVFNKLNKEIKQMDLFDNVFYYEEGNNIPIELDFIIENKNYLILGSVKNNKLTEKMKDKVFKGQTKQTMRFHKELINKKEIKIYKAASVEKDKSKEIKTINFDVNKKIIHLGISMEFISDYIFNFETPKTVGEKLINQAIISYSDFSAILQIISIEDYIDYLNERSSFSKKIKPEKFQQSVGYLDDEFTHFNLYLGNNNYISEELDKVKKMKDWIESGIDIKNYNNSNAIYFDEMLSKLLTNQKSNGKYDILDLFYFELKNINELKQIKELKLFSKNLTQEDLINMDKIISYVKENPLKEIKFKKDGLILILTQNENVNIKEKNEYLIIISKNI